MVFLAILTGIGGLFNYYGVTSATYSIIVAILLQVVLFLVWLWLVIKAAVRDQVMTEEGTVFGPFHLR